MTPELTIAIPTFDRNALVREHVGVLLPQLTDRVRLVVLDNASPTPVAQTLADLGPAEGLRIIRHRTNVGSSANVMRCIELCETPWLWILGDDDRPLPDAVATALHMIERRPDCLLINFVSMHETVAEDMVTRGVEDFVGRTPNFANLTLISNNLLRAEWLIPHVRTGCFYSYSLYPHLACVLAALRDSGAACCFSPLKLVEWGPVSEWSKVMAGVGAGVLLDLPMSAVSRRRLTETLIGMCGQYSSLAVHLLNQIGHGFDAATARHLYNQAWHRLYKRPWNPIAWAVRAAGLLMLTIPSFSARLYRRYRQLRRDPYTGGGADMRRM